MSTQSWKTIKTSKIVDGIGLHPPVKAEKRQRCRECAANQKKKKRTKEICYESKEVVASIALQFAMRLKQICLQIRHFYCRMISKQDNLLADSLLKH